MGYNFVHAQAYPLEAGMGNCEIIQVVNKLRASPFLYTFQSRYSVMFYTVSTGKS